MKSLLVIFLVLFCMQAMADGNTQTGNTINVNVKGCCEKPCKTKVVTKVVEKRVEVPVETVVSVPVYIDRVVTQTVTKRVHKKNRISLLGGMGPTNLDQVSPTQVNLNRGAIGGAMYQRSLNGTLNVGIQVQTNQTVLGSVGLDF